MSVSIIKMKSNLFFFSWSHRFYLHNSFDIWLVFSENADVTNGGKNNLQVKKVVKKVKESCLNNSERWIEIILEKLKVKLWFFSSLNHRNSSWNQEEKVNNFSDFCFQIIYRYLERWLKMVSLAWQCEL